MIEIFELRRLNIENFKLIENMSLPKTIPDKISQEYRNISQKFGRYLSLDILAKHLKIYNSNEYSLILFKLTNFLN